MAIIEQSTGIPHRPVGVEGGDHTGGRVIGLLLACRRYAEAVLGPSNPGVRAMSVDGADKGLRAMMEGQKGQ